MRRGKIWTVSGGSGYAGKPLTTNPADAALFRLEVTPSERNGLRRNSRLMVDKITTVPRPRLGGRVGRLDEEDVMRLDRAISFFLGLAS
jgi:mRNA interferase MazF